MGIQGGGRSRTAAAVGSAVAAAIAALLVVGTLGGPGGASEEEPRTPAAVPDAALTAALAAWKAFPAEAKTRPLVLLEAVSGPGGWTSKAARTKFATGNWTAPKNLPAAPARRDGYPVLAAGEALKALRADASGATSGAPLKVAGVRLGTAPFTTDRGTVRLPAWRVAFDSAKGPIWVAAVAAPARYAADAVAGPAVRTAADGRTLTLGSGTGCAAATVLESPQAVAVRPADASCSTVSLAAPLGGRVLLAVDAAGAVAGPLVVPAAKG